jgi:hypothetical protein
VKIGGRALATLVPGCPCSEFVRLPDEEFPQIDSGIIPAPYSPTQAIVFEVRRFCTGNPSTIFPSVLGITCDNYDIDDMYIAVTLRFYNGLAGCTFNPFVELGAAILATDGYEVSAPFDPLALPGTFTYVTLEVFAQLNVGVFVDDPIVNYEYLLSRV